MADEQLFAHDFKPIFSASKLSGFCTKSNEWNKNKVKFIMKFSPFLEIKRELEMLAMNQMYKNSKPLISESMKYEIKLAIVDKYNESASFDDANVASIITRPSSSSQVNSVTSDIDENRHEKYYMIDENKDESETRSDFINYIRNNEEPELTKAISKSISTQRGLHLEIEMIKKINEEKNANFVQNKVKKLIDLEDFVLSGIVDAFDEQNQIILEVKTRNKLIGKVVIKEKRQALVYMKIWQCEKCLLLERGPNPNEENLFEIEWNETEFENDVVNKLKEFCQNVRSLTETQFRQLYAKYFIN